MPVDATNRFFAPKSAPLVLGHRGAPWLHQESSLAGIRRALSLGAAGVELDVFLTKDDEVVVFHDEDLYRLTDHKGRINDLTWDEVSELRLQRTIHLGKNARGEEVLTELKVDGVEADDPAKLLEALVG